MKRSLTLLLGLALLVPFAWPQASTSSVSGTVRDPSGAVFERQGIGLKDQLNGLWQRGLGNLRGGRCGFSAGGEAKSNNNQNSEN